MTATHANQIIDGYLKRLDGELGDLPPSRRREVAGQIAEHITEARSELAEETDADLLTILDRLGEPDEIAAEARASFNVSPQRPGAVEILALVLLGIGGVLLPLPPAIWLLAIVLVWRSKVWAPRTKYFGAYLPFVIGLALLVMSALAAGLFERHLIEIPVLVALLGCILIPIGSAIFLGLRIGRRLPALAWVAIAIVCVAVYVPSGATLIPARASAFIGTEAGLPTFVPAPGGGECGGFYGTITYAQGTPLVAKVPVSVGICWDGQTVKKTWGPDCFPDYGLGLIVKVQSCTVTDSPDGSLFVTVQSTVTALTSPGWTSSYGTDWRITPDGKIMHFGP